IDSVLTHDGRHVVGKVGGNALWSSLGALVAGIAPRIVTVVGSDYPQDVLSALVDVGIDTSAVRRIDRSHPVRVTFAHMPDGSRLQPVPEEMIRALPEADRAAFIDTTLLPDVLPLGAPVGSDVPQAWLSEIGHWHLPLLPLHRHRDLVRRISAGRGLLQSDCPARSDLAVDPFGRIALTLGDLDVFLPSTSDFDVIAPDLAVEEILFRLRAQGARTIVLKAGADGVYVSWRDGLFHMPAYAAVPVDPTGAGDAFCGGFMTGMAVTGGDVLEAAALGSAAASFAVATEDPLALIGVDREQVRQRARQLHASVRRIGGGMPGLSAVNE
ncbi:MAG: carbohydrate kinase family protein, partial [Oricola sp.]